MAWTELLASSALLLVAVYIIVRQVKAVRAEHAFRESHQFATEIIENAGEGIVVYDTQLRYVLFNRFMEELTGLRAADVVGRSAPEVFPHIREQHVDELLQRALAGEQVSSPDIFYYVPNSDRRGWVSGRDSLVSSLLTETGLLNPAGELGVAFGGFASMEAIISLKPDFILVSEAGDRAEDDGRAFLLHPALERFYPPEKRIVIPERLTVCGGVMLAEALDVLTAELKRVSR